MEVTLESPSKEIENFVCCIANDDNGFDILVSNDHKSNFSVQKYVNAIQQTHKNKTKVKFVSLEDVGKSKSDIPQEDLETTANQRKVIQYFNIAKKMNASDIHFSIGRDNSNFTFVEVRVHGELEEIACIEKAEGMALVSTICLSMCDVTEKQFYPNRHQDGRIKEEFLKPVGLFGARYSHVPAVGGLYAVMRLIPDDGDSIPSTAELGFLEEQRKLIDKILKRPEGIVILSGPTGSGKSTTLRSFSAQYLKITKKKKRLLTIEDPPEGRIPGAIQTSIIADKKDATAVSAAWLRAISSSLRLDPDSILNGEMRDFDSALAAINATMTGHLILTTLHANDAISIMERLVIMGLTPKLIADAQLLIGLISQRLVQRLCDNCKIRFEDIKDKLESEDVELVEKYCDAEKVRLRNHQGCKDCYKGITGRTVISEVITPDAKFMHIYLNEGKPAAKTYWHSNLGGITRNQHLLHYVNNGMVDPLEAHNIAPIDEDSYTLLNWDGDNVS